MVFRLALISGLLLSSCFCTLQAHPVQWIELIAKLNERSYRIHQLFVQMEKDLLSQKEQKGGSPLPLDHRYGLAPLPLLSHFDLDKKSLQILGPSLHEAEERFQAFFRLKETYYQSGGHSDLLREMAICLEDLESLHSRIYFHIQNRWKEEDFPHSPESEFFLRSQELVDTGRQLVQAVRGGMEKEIQQKHQATLEAFQLWKKGVNQLSPSQKKPIKGKIELFEGQWQQVLFISKHYPSQEVPDLYKKVGKDYFIFNHRLMPLFSDNKGGIVVLHNDMLRQMGHDFPPSLLRLPWLYAPPKTKPRLPTHLVVLLDQSGSMAREERMTAIKAMLPSYLNHLPPNSRFSFVGWNEASKVYLKSTQDWKRMPEILKKIQAEGEIEDNQGLNEVYNLPVLPGYEVQILLISDGGFPINKELLLQVENGAYYGQKLNMAFMGEQKRKASLSKLCALSKGRLFDLQYPRDREALQEMIKGFEVGD